MKNLIRAINESPVQTRLTEAINVSFDGKSEWSVIKYGVYPNKVGLQIFDREAAQKIHAAFNDKSNRLASVFRGEPIYVGHPDDPDWARANPGIRAQAVGRIRETKVEEDGLHLKPAYNDDGKRLVGGEAPAYEAFSPNWGMVPTTYQGRKAFRPVELYSIGLTNQPNIPGSYIGLNEALPAEPSNLAMKNHIIALLAALGRPVANAAAVTDEQLATAVNESVPVATQYVADAGKLAGALNEVATLKPKVTAAEAQVTTAVNETATLRTALATERAARAGVVITRAVNEGRLTEAQRTEWLGKFTAQGADFAAVETDLGKLKTAVNTKTQTPSLGGRRGVQDTGKIAAINEAVSAKQKDSGLSHHEAYLAVKRAKPELFATAAS